MRVMATPLGLHGEEYLLLDFGQGSGEQRWASAAHLIGVVVRFWRDFSNRFRPTVALIHSEHHVF